MRLFAGLLIATALLAQTASQLKYSGEKMVLPANYREWIYLSSGLGMSYTPAAQDSANPAFTNTFVNPDAYRAFQKTGAWPDKTVIVLELRGSENHASIATSGRSQAAVVAVEAHVKDASKGGWAFYAFGKSTEGTLEPKTQNCYSCHEQNGAVDSTFAQYYPTIAEIAKAKGTFKEPSKH